MDGDQLVGIVDEATCCVRVRRTEALPRPGAHRDGQQRSCASTRSPRSRPCCRCSTAHVGIVMDGEKFLGLITRIDLLNYLRRRVQ